MGTPFLGTAREPGTWLDLAWEESGVLAGSCGEEEEASLAMLKEQHISRCSTWEGGEDGCFGDESTGCRGLTPLFS